MFKKACLFLRVGGGQSVEPATDCLTVSSDVLHLKARLFFLLALANHQSPPLIGHLQHSTSPPAISSQERWPIARRGVLVAASQCPTSMFGSQQFKKCFVSNRLFLFDKKRVMPHIVESGRSIAICVRYYVDVLYRPTNISLDPNTHVLHSHQSLTSRSAQ